MNNIYSYFTDFLFTDKKALEYITDKKKSVNAIMKEMVNRLQMMFEYRNLPDSIPANQLETYLLINGQCIIAKPKGAKIPKTFSPDSLYAFTGSPGGEPDPYYRPTKYMVANPALHYTNEFTIFPSNQLEVDAVLMRNDTLWEGLYPLMSRYAALISENLLTIRSADIMLRVTALITAANDKDKIAADVYLKKLANGELAAIAENRFLDGIKMQNPPSNNGSYLTQFIELHQYLTGRFYNDIGLNSNYNMKREALSESETGLNEDSLPTLAENMLLCRQEDLSAVNQLFGTNISVEFASSWRENVKEHKLHIKQLEAEIKDLKNASNQLDKGTQQTSSPTTTSTTSSESSSSPTSEQSSTSSSSNQSSNQLEGSDNNEPNNLDTPVASSTDSQSDISDGEHSGDSSSSSGRTEESTGTDSGDESVRTEDNSSGSTNNSDGINITIITANSIESIGTDNSTDDATATDDNISNESDEQSDDD